MKSHEPPRLLFIPLEILDKILKKTLIIILNEKALANLCYMMTVRLTEL
jgi:hypothetical protein